MKEVPKSIGQLNELQKLDLNLEELPESISELNALQDLDLRSCSKLKETFIYWTIKYTPTTSFEGVF